MGMVNTNVKQAYACNGVTTSFAIPFAWYDTPQIIVTLITVADGTRTLLVEGVDYTLDPSFDPILIVNPDPMAPPPIPTVVTTATVYTSDYQLEVARNTPLTQIVSYINNSQFNAEDHEAGMNRIVMMIQELKSYVDTQDAEIMALIEELEEQLAASGALPEGGDEHALLEKNSSGVGDSRWTDPLTFQGFSQRFSTLVDLSGIYDIIAWILNIQHAEPTVTLSASGVSVREKGTAVTSTNLSAVIGKLSEVITEVRFYIGGTLLDTQTSGGGIPDGGTSSYSWSGSFSDNTTFSVQVDDISHSPATTRAVTFPFVYPYYVGAGASGLNAAGIAGLTKLVVQQNNNHAVSITATAGQRLYYAFPAAYGDLTSILDENGFEILGAFTKRTVSITGLDATSQSYTVYEGNNALSAGAYPNTYKR